MPIKSICTDIDGTLTGGKPDVLSIDAIKAIRDLQERGISVILASGNAYPTVRTLARYIGCSDAMICECGSVVGYKGTIKVLASRGAPMAALKLAKERFGERIQEVWSNAYFLAHVAIKRTITRKELEGVTSPLSAIRILDSGYAYHLLPEGVDKGVALRALCEMMGMKPEEVASIGDSELDVELLRDSGFGVALANSPPELVRVAHYITSEDDGEGFCEAVRVILEEVC